MNNYKVKSLVSSIKLACLFTCLMIGTACSYEPLTITGSVVDESGNALSDVTVWACYSGWGWAEEVGYLVWDKNYCSETTQTNHDGLYVITFKGPVSSRLKARKEGWVQTQDYIPANSRIVLTSREDYGVRLRTEAKQRVQEHQRRRAEESETDYYCRVIFQKSRPINLNYQEETLAITPTLFESDDKSGALFAAVGSARAVDAFANEVVLKVNGVAQDCNFSFNSVETGCGQDVHFIEVRAPDFNEHSEAEVEILIPTIKAMFDVRLHTLSAHQY